MDENRDYCYELAQNLYGLINSSPAALSVKYYVVKDVFNELTAGYNQFLAQKREETKKAVPKEEEAEGVEK